MKFCYFKRFMQWAGFFSCWLLTPNTPQYDPLKLFVYGKLVPKLWLCRIVHALFSWKTVPIDQQLMYYLQVKLGDKEVDIMEGFGLYMTTKLANPSYTPEVRMCISFISGSEKTNFVEFLRLRYKINALRMCAI